MKHFEIYNKNITEINHLLRIRTALKDTPGFRRNLEILNKSTIVLLVACWEAYVEELATISFDFLLLHAPDHKTFPAKVLTQASKVFWDSKDERGVWGLADDGWKTILTSHRDKIINEYLGNFHTPRPAQIDKLFESLIGLSTLSSNWHWRNMTNAKAKKKLEDLITLRGSIAHRVSTTRSITLKYTFECAYLLARLGMISSNTVRNFIHTRTGEYPWIEAEILDTSI